LYLSAKNGSLTFPSIVNTGLLNGGFFEENKKEILSNIPQEYVPESIYIEPDTDFTSIYAHMEIKNITYPIIAKPLDEQRGKNVEIIQGEAELLQYYLKISKAFVIQEFVTFPLELAILYSRLPNQNKGTVSSVTSKDFLSVTGDGKKTIEQLLKSNLRAKMIWSEIQKNVKLDFQQILPYGETKVVEKIGNHCRGTIFRNAQEINKEKTAAVIDKIMSDFKGFYYGRFDLKVKSIADLYLGKNIKILELNGVNADAAHIFDPKYSLFQAYKDVAWHWKRLNEIANFNRKLGHQPITLKNVIRKIK
jgi:hypothetical protein